MVSRNLLRATMAEFLKAMSDANLGQNAEDLWYENAEVIYTQSERIFGEIVAPIPDLSAPGAINEAMRTWRETLAEWVRKRFIDG